MGSVELEVRGGTKLGGADADAPRFGEESLRWAIYTGMGFYLLASVLLIGASRTLKRDWVD